MIVYVYVEYFVNIITIQCYVRYHHCYHHNNCNGSVILLYSHHNLLLFTLCLLSLALSWAVWMPESFFSLHVGLPSSTSLTPPLFFSCRRVWTWPRRNQVRIGPLRFSEWDYLRFPSRLRLCLQAGAMPATSPQQVGSRGRCIVLLHPLLSLLLMALATRPGQATINIPSNCEYGIAFCHLHCILCVPVLALSQPMISELARLRKCFPVSWAWPLRFQQNVQFY